MQPAVLNLNNNKGLACMVALILFCLLVHGKCVRYITIDEGTYNLFNNLWMMKYRR